MFLVFSFLFLHVLFCATAILIYRSALEYLGIFHLFALFFGLKWTWSWHLSTDPLLPELKNTAVYKLLQSAIQKLAIDNITI